MWLAHVRGGRGSDDGLTAAHDTMRSARDLAADITEQLSTVGTPERAAAERRYLKSELAFLGATVWEVRRVIGAFDRSLSLDRAGVVSLVQELWRPAVHERRMAAVDLLELYQPDLRVADMAVLERLLRSRAPGRLSTRSPVVAGPLVERHPELGATLDRWAGDDDFWVRRAALLALLLPLRRGGGDFERFARYADAMLEEREFFIRKAIGWVLRDTSKKRPERSRTGLAPRADRASGVTMREAVKYLPDASARSSWPPTAPGVPRPLSRSRPEVPRASCGGWAPGDPRCGLMSAWGRTIDAKVLSQQGLAAPYGAATMTLRPSRATPRRPMLLVLVYASVPAA